MAIPNPRAALARWFTLATLLATAGIVAVAIAAAVVTVATRTTAISSSSSSTALSTARPAAGIGGGYEAASAVAAAPAEALGGAVLAAAEDQHAWDVMRAMVSLAEQEQQRQAAAAASASRVQASSVQNPAASLNRASGYAPGTVLRARITVYGCTGPGGGFCGGMASGVRVFEGAAACSPDLPFGTKIKIHGDPTGRVYECLDRGALSTTWVDVFFNNTSEGIRWAGLLGGTSADIEIVN